MENGAGLSQRLADLEDQVSVLVDLVFETLKLVGALNANVARLGAHTEDADRYEERWQAMDEDVTTLLTRLTDRWTRDEPPEAQG